MERAAALLKRLGLEGHHETDPIVVAARIASAAMDTDIAAVQSPLEDGFDAVRGMPPTSYQFNRGVAMGIAMMLSTEA
jgi:hypothetical protein